MFYKCYFYDRTKLLDASKQLSFVGSPYFDSIGILLYIDGFTHSAWDFVKGSPSDICDHPIISQDKLFELVVGKVKKKKKRIG